MLLRHVLAAADESDAGRQAVRTAIDLAARSSARITILRVGAVEGARRLVSVGDGAPHRDGGQEKTALARLRQWLEADVLSPAEARTADFAIAYGEAARFRVSIFKQRGNVSMVATTREQHNPLMRSPWSQRWTFQSVS